MSFLPIVQRELLVAARRSGTHRVRFLSALGFVITWLILTEGFGRNSANSLSRTLFIAFGVLALAFCLFAGVFLTSDCLSEEKRQGTLGLLFLTNLKGYDVVLGKLIATSIHAAYGLLAIFPILDLPLLMGGVTAGEFWRMQLALIGTLLLSLSLGMFASALSRESREAMGMTFLALLVLGGVLPSIYWLHRVLFRSASGDAWLLVSPVQTFICALEDHYRTRVGAHSFWTSLVIVAALSLGFLSLAMLIVPRTWKEGATETDFGKSCWHLFRRWGGKQAQLSPLLNRTHSLATTHPNSLALTANPYAWLTARRRSPQLWGWLTVWLLFGVWGCFLAASMLQPVRRVPAAFIATLFTTYAIHQAVKALAAADATRQLNEDRLSGALELVLVSPVTEAEIIAGHSLVFQQKYHLPTLLLVGTNLCMVFASLTWGQRLGMNGQDQAVFLELFLGGILMVFFDFRAIRIVGASSALRAQRQHRAVLGTLGRVMAPSWAAIFLMIFYMQLVRIGGAGTAAVIFACWFGIGIINDVAAINQARIALASGFKRWIA